MIVVDSSVWISWLRGEEAPAVSRLGALAEGADIVIGDIVLMEILRGARSHDHAAAIDRRLRSFPLVPMMTPDLAREAARHYRDLRQEGVTIRTSVDLVIATFCIASGARLLHRDRDFEPFVRYCGLTLA